MSVNHYLLAVSDEELAAILRTPEHIRKVVEKRNDDVCGLGEDGLAIVSLTAESAEDPLAFIRMGASDPAVAGWVGRCAEGEECEVDMGYGPASYYRNSFLRKVAKRLRPITYEVFAANCDVDWLEEHDVYPGYWHDEGRRETLIESFNLYRICVLGAADSGRHLLV